MKFAALRRLEEYVAENSAHGFSYGPVTAHRRANEPVCQPCKDFENARAKERYQKNREAKLVYQSQYSKTHRIQMNAWAREWRRSNIEAARARNREYYKNNKDKNVAKFARRRARLKGNGISPYTLEQILEKYGAVCYLCEVVIDLNAPRSARQKGWEYGLHLDHVIPISKGGPDCLDNVAPTHAICNLSKGA
jgi:5-methylcytosine-specific restriction endonuclease McrA